MVVTTRSQDTTGSSPLALRSRDVERSPSPVAKRKPRSDGSLPPSIKRRRTRDPSASDEEGGQPSDISVLPTEQENSAAHHVTGLPPMQANEPEVPMVNRPTTEEGLAVEEHDRSVGTVEQATVSAMETTEKPNEELHFDVNPKDVETQMPPTKDSGRADDAAQRTGDTTQPNTSPSLDEDRKATASATNSHSTHIRFNSNDVQQLSSSLEAASTDPSMEPHEQVATKSDDDAPEAVTSKSSSTRALLPRSTQSTRKIKRKSGGREVANASAVSKTAEDTAQLEASNTDNQPFITVLAPEGTDIVGSVGNNLQIPQLERTSQPRIDADLRDESSQTLQLKRFEKPARRETGLALAPRSNGSFARYQAGKLKGVKTQAIWGGRTAFLKGIKTS